ncbi:YciI family protein [Rhizobium cauense]|uniref:YciI family protein n=1 Tax=Rhizobium cauense TaxID=1166683 RepID=UPI001C6E1A98|nr:YciI family protein [Rhizobium cauense]MBW9113919.1 YciI family protein [Rhizobium cauense]
MAFQHRGFVMLAIRIATSNPDMEHERDQHMKRHRHHLRSATFKIVLSGPVFDKFGSQNGAVVLAEVDDLVELQTFSDSDPFVVHGVYREVTISRWSATIDNR